MLCFVKKALERIMRYTLISHTNVCPIQGRSTLRGFECFQNRQSGVSFRAGHQANRPAVNRTMPGCFIDNFFSSLAVPCYFPEAKSLLKYLTSLFNSENMILRVIACVIALVSSNCEANSTLVTFRISSLRDLLLSRGPIFWGAKNVI